MKPVITIDYVNAFVKPKGGRSISRTYKNAHEKLEWECGLGHRWKTNWNQIQQGTWCPECKKIKLQENWSNQAGSASKFKCASVKELRKLAKDRGGVLLSSEYTNSKSKLQWRCDKGHEWGADAAHTKNGRWCPVCAVTNRIANRRGKTAPLKIEDLQKIAESKGGRLLSDKYERAHQILKWQCEEGHKWNASAFSIKTNGTWCSLCSQGVSERIARGYLEKIFSEQFPKKRPKWLINASGNRMELDGYSKKLQIAFEYNGRQHFFDVRHFTNGSELVLAKRKRDDLKKRYLCRKHGLVLVEIPFTVSHEEMGAFIINELKKAGVDIPKGVASKNLNYKEWAIYSPKRMNEMKAFAQNKDGDCLSTHYINNSTKLKWKCAVGHMWEASPSNIFSGKWCPACAITNRGGSKKYSLSFLQEMAKEHDGRLLSKEFTALKADYDWECSEGHVFRTKASTVHYLNTWCPKCAANRISTKMRKYDIKDLKDFAKARKGRCLSDVFVSSSQKVKWECEHRHRWEQKWSHIKGGVWCPNCAGK